MKRLLLSITILLILCSGCFGPRIVKHPDAPMLIEEVSWGKASVAIYSKKSNSLIHYGWIKIPVGWTLHKFDWERHIESND